MKNIIISILYYIICLLDVDFDIQIKENLAKVEKLKKMDIKLPKNRSEALDLYLELAQKGYFDKDKKYNDMALAEIGGIMISSLDPKPSEKFQSLEIIYKFNADSTISLYEANIKNTIYTPKAKYIAKYKK